MKRELPRLYAVTDDTVVPNAELVARTERLLFAGVRLVQVRFKKTPFAEQVALGRELRGLTSHHGALLIADDSPRLAAEIGADGVHLGAEDATVEEARALLGPEAIVGVSGYDEESRVAAIDPSAVDYAGLSSPYPSLSKEKRTPPPERFVALVRRSPVPVFAIGGLTPERTPAMMAAGCHGVAAIAALNAAPDPAAAVARFLAALAARRRKPSCAWKPLGDGLPA
jgi:thiamine-phosphate pyrophosphorylase